MKELTAVGAYIFAGGFTLGVEQSFNVLAHMEGSDYGVATFKLNRPDIPVYVGHDDWPLEHLKGRLNFLYCNPPCAPFSVVGASLLKGKDNWKTDPRMSCHAACMNAFRTIKPDCMAIESVPMAYKRGKELFDEMTVECLEMGYSVTHLFEDAQWYGIPQKRERYMFIAHKHELSMERCNWQPAPTIGETIKGITNHEFVRHVSPHLLETVKQTPQGMGTRTIWERLNPPETWVQGPNGVKGRPRFCEYRAEENTQMGAFIGDFVLHPTEHRYLSLAEAKAICGFPEDYKFSNPKQAFSELARGVMPCVGAYVARSVANSIINGQLVTSPSVRILDMRRPKDTMEEMITPLFAVEVPLETDALNQLGGDNDKTETEDESQSSKQAVEQSSTTSEHQQEVSC